MVYKILIDVFTSALRMRKLRKNIIKMANVYQNVKKDTIYYYKQHVNNAYLISMVDNIGFAIPHNALHNVVIIMAIMKVKNIASN